MRSLVKQSSYQSMTEDMEGVENKAYSPGDEKEDNHRRPVSSQNSVSNGATARSGRGPDPDTELDNRCGLGSKPDCLQPCNNARVVCVWLCWFAFVQGFVVNGINNVNTTSLERRFELTSAEVSLVSSSYDISAGVLVIPITYFGAFAHQPRMLAVAALIMALGSVVMSVPHFATGLYELSEVSSDQCLAGNATDAEGCTSSQISRYLGVLILGQILHGVGGTTVYSIGIVYLDTNVKTKNSPLYQGLLYGFAALGPACGYLLGGVFVNSIYVDFDQVPRSEINLTAADPRWVGAWWIGCVAAAILAFPVFWFLLPYGRELPYAQVVRRERVSQAHCDGSEEIANKEGFGTTIKDLPMSLKLLLKNPVYMMLNMAGVSEGIATSGFATFLPKFIQNQFGQSPGYAAILAGLLVVPGAAGGQFIAGLIAKCANMRVRQMLHLCVGATVVATVFVISILTHCSSDPLAGVNVAYDDSNVMKKMLNLTHDCNSQCQCNTRSYEPLCGANGIQYFSPCHAGCNTLIQNGTKVYVNCHCIPDGMELPDSPSQAQDGKCPQTCSLMYVFLPMIFVTIFLTFMAAVPTVSVTLRVVADRQRSFALGIQWVFIRFLGTVPGPIIFGAIIDSTCLVWQEKCGQNGSCWVYDNGLLSQRVLILAVCIKSLSSFFFIMATVLYKAPPDDTSSMTKSTQSTDDVSNGTRDISYAMKSLESVEGHKDFPGYVECRDRGYVNPAFSDDLGSSTTGNATGSRPDGQDEAL